MNSIFFFLRVHARTYRPRASFLINLVDEDWVDDGDDDDDDEAAIFDNEYD